MSRIKPRFMVLMRAEGPSKLCGIPAAFTRFMDADRRLRIWADTAPKNGGYNKVDFAVIYTDGECYSGRIDLTGNPEDIEGPFNVCLGEHMRRHVQSFDSDESAKKALLWLEKYALEDYP